MSGQAKPVESPDDPGFINTVLTRTRLIDIVLLMSVPGIVLLFYQLPPGIRRSMVFNPDTPMILSAFTAHYVHFELGHLFGNLWLYGLTAPVIYLLFIFSDCRREFHFLAIPILLFFPFVLSALNFMLPRDGIVIFGFSGLGMAFVGALPVALFRFLAERVPRSIGVSDGLWLFFIGAALIAFRMAPTGIGVAIGFGAGFIAVLLLLRLIRSIGSIKQAELARAFQYAGHFELVAIAPIIFFLATLMAFPANPYRFGGVLDLTMHLFGYLFGFTLSFFVVWTIGVLSNDDVPEPPDDIQEPEYDDS